MASCRILLVTLLIVKNILGQSNEKDYSYGIKIEGIYNGAAPFVNANLYYKKKKIILVGGVSEIFNYYYSRTNFTNMLGATIGANLNLNLKKRNYVNMFLRDNLYATNTDLATKFKGDFIYKFRLNCPWAGISYERLLFNSLSIEAGITYMIIIQKEYWTETGTFSYIEFNNFGGFIGLKLNVFNLIKK